MRVIGTAGHVDHGKSTLIEALSGINPDRLKEEQEREMTIDLGFAWLTLPDGEEVGIIDVPGHRDFIENMLAGIGGIDAALFVVAADEGVMPQTREHLAILDLLQIQGGVIVITKIDLVDDEWVELVEDDLREVLKATVLENSPIIRVSSRTGAGLPRLLETLSKDLADRPPRPDLRRPRLPIDRVFTIAGFGTVVTGTLTDGHFRIGEEVEILPQIIKGRIRGLQTHKQKEDSAVPGSRTAINISGVAVDLIQRGDVVTHPGSYLPTRRLDVHFRLLPEVSGPVTHNMESKLFVGSSEVLARIRLLGVQELLPGEEGWLQLETRSPVVASRGDRYILRRPSPGETMGGGIVLDPHPSGRYKRFSDQTIKRLETIKQGTPTQILQQALLLLGAASLGEVVAKSNLDVDDAAKASRELFKSGVMLPLEHPNNAPHNDKTSGQNESLIPDTILVISRTYWDNVAESIIRAVEEYHREYPLRSGMPRQELRSRLNALVKSSSRLFSLALEKLFAENELVEAGPIVYRPGHSIRFKTEQDERIKLLLKRFRDSPYAPPSYKESQAEVGDEVLAALLSLDQLIAVSNDVLFRRVDYDNMVDEIRRLMEDRGTLTAAEVRDHFKTSRKYVLALLEHLDREGITIREGDVRRLRS
jgi:selenocysteine-specific elongation factor